MSAIDAEKLRQLHAKATQGPWSVETEAEPEDEFPRVYVCHPATVCNVTVVATMGHSILSDRTKQAEADAEYLAAAWATLPELLNRIEALEAGIRSMIPKNVNLDHPRWPDSTVLPVDVTLGELRSLRALLQGRPDVG